MRTAGFALVRELAEVLNMGCFAIGAPPSRISLPGMGSAYDTRDLRAIAR